MGDAAEQVERSAKRVGECVEEGDALRERPRSGQARTGWISQSSSRVEPRRAESS